MASSALVSVIMPVHNGARFLREALDSALAQTHQQVEIIVVDDGSTDDTPRILESYGSRITHIRQANSGAAAARNAAIAIARGEFLAFLDADDLWTPQKLSVQVEYLQTHPQLDLVASRWRVLAPGPGLDMQEPTQLTDPQSEWIYNELLMDCIVHTTTVVMRRTLLDKIGDFDVSLLRGQDYDYWLRASRVTPIHRLPVALSVYRLHEKNSTWRPQPVNYAAIILERSLRRWGRKGPDGRVTPLSTIRRRLSEVWFSFGYQHARGGSLRQAIAAAFRSVRAWPLHSKPWLLLAACALAPLRRFSRAPSEQRAA